MKSSICVTNRKPTASFGIVSLLLAIAPVWLLQAAAALNTVLPTNASDPTSPADWTEFHRDNMQRWNPYETVLGVGNVGELKLKWQFQFPGQPLQPSPTVVNGVVYVAAIDTDRGVNEFYALNAGTGAKLRSYLIEGDVYTSPAVANGVVYFGSDDGNLYALNSSTGAKLWSYATGGHSVLPRPQWRMGWFMSASEPTTTCTR